MTPPPPIPTPLVLPAPLAKRIETEGEQGYPAEVCGILIGRDVAEDTAPRRVVDSIVPGKNVFEPGERYHRFTIDPGDQLEAERAAEKEGRLVLGYYHSHPDHPARPSEYDRTHAWPFYSYVIVSVEKGRAAEMTSWVLDEATEQFARQEIERNT